MPAPNGYRHAPPLLARLGRPPPPPPRKLKRRRVENVLFVALLAAVLALGAHHAHASASHTTPSTHPR